MGSFYKYLGGNSLVLKCIYFVWIKILHNKNGRVDVVPTQEIYKFRARFLSQSVTLAGSIDETLEFCRIYTSWAFSNNLTDVHVRTGAVKDPQYHLE